MININNKYPYKYIIFYINNELDFNMIIKSFKITNETRNNYNLFKEHINSNSYIALNLLDGNIYYINKELLEKNFKYDNNILEIDPTIYYSNNIDLSKIIFYIENGYKKPTYDSKKIIRENNEYKYSDILIGIYNLSDAEYLKTHKDIYKINNSVLNDIISYLDKNSYYIRLSLNQDNNFIFSKYGRISNAYDNSISNNFTYEKIFNITDLKNNLIQNILLYGKSIIGPTYFSKKIIRESVKVLRFNELDNIEYRKGSSKFGGLILKLMEFLRLHKDKELNNLEFNINDFEKESNITIDEIKDLMNDKNGKNLYVFNIDINDDKIKFSNLTTDKNRYFESFDINIRHNYELMGIENYYKNIGNEYINPHLKDIKDSIIEINSKNIVDFSNVLDLSAGKGEITTILEELGYSNIIGTDPYLYNEYMKETGKKCYKYTFKDIQKGKLDNKKYSTIVCSYAMHLAKPSVIPILLWKLSLISKYLIILSPNNKPDIKNNIGWSLIDHFKKGKCKVRIFISKNIYE